MKGEIKIRKVIPFKESKKTENVTLSDYGKYYFKNRFDFSNNENINAGKFRLILSYDQFNNFFNSDAIGYGYYHIIFYDDNDLKELDYDLLSKAFAFFSSQNNCFINFVLSHKNIEFYANMIRKWFSDEQIKKIKLIMINEFDKSIQSFNIDNLPCKLMVPSSMMNNISFDVLSRNLDNIVCNFEKPFNDKKEILHLKRFTEKFVDKIRKNYYFDDLTDLEKAKIVFYYIKRYVRYTTEATYMDGNIQGLKSDSKYNFASLPYSTLKNKSGVCSGQASAMEALLNNSEMNVNARVAKGNTGRGMHAWCDIYIDNKIYSCCLTGNSFCGSLNKLGYTYLENYGSRSYYERQYELPHVFLSKDSFKRIDESLIRKLRK